jgi:hypothetical protein
MFYRFVDMYFSWCVVVAFSLVTWKIGVRILAYGQVVSTSLKAARLVKAGYGEISSR